MWTLYGIIKDKEKTNNNVLRNYYEKNYKGESKWVRL